MSGSAKDFQSIISKLHKAVADYQEGCARIDREFDTTKKALSEDQERNRNIRRSNWQAGFFQRVGKKCNCYSERKLAAQTTTTCLRGFLCR